MGGGACHRRGRVPRPDDSTLSPLPADNCLPFPPSQPIAGGARPGPRAMLRARAPARAPAARQAGQKLLIQPLGQKLLGGRRSPSLTQNTACVQHSLYVRTCGRVPRQLARLRSGPKGTHTGSHLHPTPRSFACVRVPRQLARLRSAPRGTGSPSPRLARMPHQLTSLAAALRPARPKGPKGTGGRSAASGLTVVHSVSSPSAHTP